MKSPSLSQDRQPGPAGKVKLANALRQLLAEKDFISITTAEISRAAGTNEALIYRYFGDKRGLLHEVLSEHLDSFFRQIVFDLKGIEGAVNKLRKLTWTHIYLYDHDRVLSKILLLEVRNSPGYFESKTYRTVQQYTRMILDIIEEGVQNGEIRDDVPAASLRQMILGSMEHLCLPFVIFNKAMDVDELHQDLCRILFGGILKKR